MTNTLTTQPATAKQVAFIERLIAERPDWAERLDGNDFERAFDIATKSDKFLGKSEASHLIDMLLKVRPATKTVATPTAKVAVRTGYYAVEREGTTKFFRVNCPTDGKWAGRVFVDAQASDEFYGVRNATTRRDILEDIERQGVDACMARYGQLIGKCGHCNRTLTDELSRSIGIGPVCRER